MMRSRPERLQNAIDKTADGYFHVRTVLILGLGNAADAIEILSIGYILAVYEDHEGPLSRFQQSVLAAAIFAGMFMGGLIFGILSDQVGRRKSLLYSLFINGFFALVSSASPNIYALIIFRMCAGIGIGGSVPAMFTLCLEHVPVHRRGFYVAIVASYWMVGSIFTAALAWFMFGGQGPHYSWRVFAAVVAVPSFICWFLTYKFVPESAQFFARRRLFSEAEKVVKHIRHTNGHASDLNTPTERTDLLSPFGKQDVEIIYGVDIEALQEHKQLTIVQSYSMLFDPVLRATTLSLLLSWFCQSFGSYGLTTWITVLFKHINLSDPFANAFIYAAANLPGNLISALFMDVIGGRRILFVSMLLAAGCAAGFAAVNRSTDEDPSTAACVAIIALASGFNACTTAGWNAIDLMSTESFPTDVRTTGMGMLAASGRAGSVLAQLVNGYLVGPPVHITLLLTITSCLMLLGSVSSFLVTDYSGKSLPGSIEDMKKQQQQPEKASELVATARKQ